MHIKFSTSECLILAGAILGASGLIAPMWTCLGLGTLGSFVRYSLEHAERQAQKKLISENVDGIKDFASEFATILNSMGSSSGTKRYGKH